MLLWWLRWQSVCLQGSRPGFDPWVGKILWRRRWQPTPVLVPGKSHGWRSLVGYSLWGHKESDTTGQLHFLSLSPLKQQNNVIEIELHCEGLTTSQLVFYI